MFGFVDPAVDGDEPVRGVETIGDGGEELDAFVGGDSTGEVIGEFVDGE